MARDCPADQRCVAVEGGHVCALAEELHCVHNSDCNAPLVCAIDLQCRDRCVSDRDCVAGDVCAKSMVCAPPELLDPSGDLPHG
jgi:hypothetical protein